MSVTNLFFNWSICMQHMLLIVADCSRCLL